MGVWELQGPNLVAANSPWSLRFAKLMINFWVQVRVMRLADWLEWADPNEYRKVGKKSVLCSICQKTQTTLKMETLQTFDSKFYNYY
jgi:hypothetical protein